MKTVEIFTKERCEELIRFSEELGYEDAPVTTSSGPVMMKNYRNNERVIHFSKDLAEEIFETIKDEVPFILGFEPIGLNEMFRFYKYGKGHFFNQHRDGPYIRNSQEASHVTLLIYLNEDYDGGETAFKDPGQEDFVSLTPKTGMGCMFIHKKLHRGNEVLDGIKYAIRTDIMYRLK
ncbi:MAG: 2OG-Fe(II) oxygenase superfamily protein [uncultured marine phage]|uniref:2OG-Fe(II) oxygenase superfamily protein n=1 Tax=uncultured marine phage TaxID=707152 RepID=A0A8D9CAE2_9VIRU|nr:MAG: 2OG-Fe(II) oxygenase superfamily protein [uncultured marine phage]